MARPFAIGRLMFPALVVCRRPEVSLQPGLHRNPREKTVERQVKINAALLAIAILAAKRPELREKLRAWRKSRAEEVIKTDKSVSGS